MLKKLLKKTLIGLGIFLLVILITIIAFIGYFRYRDSEPLSRLKTDFHSGELGRYVNPFIGTGGYPWVCGQNFPGSALPFSVVRLSPDTESSLFKKKALNTSGYYYPDNQIIGFSHTRLSGTGATDGGHFRIIPSTSGNGWMDYLKGNYAKFSHKNETAFPGYYSVKLKRPSVLVELSSTARTGIHRYTFAKNDQPHILFDVCSVLGNKKTDEGKVIIHQESGEIEGEARTYGNFSGRSGGIKVYFFARFDHNFSKSVIWNSDTSLTGRNSYDGAKLGVDLTFDRSEQNQKIELRVGISHVSRENARMNLESETSGKSFETLVSEAVTNWEKTLSLVNLEGGDKKEKTIFYTALYRTFLMPTLFQDVNGDYFGFDKKVHKAEGFNYYTDLSLWDTFRTLHPLFILIAPKEQRDMLVSLVKMKEQGGWLPRWPSGTGYTNSMLGSPADVVISESYQKGIRDFDVKSAYEGMKQIALAPTPEGSAYSGRRGIKDYLAYQYCPSDLMEQAVSRTLEYAWADHAIAVLADSLGLKEDADIFYRHAMYYKNTWNPATKYFQPRDSKGNFSELFKPLLLTYRDKGGIYTNDYVEGSALQWRFAVPFDQSGLISLFGGKEPFVKELNDFFAKSDPTMGRWSPGSYYWHGNEPDIHSAYLFNEAGRPDLTQKWSRWILENKYGVGANGLDGNDDGATLSSWYIFGSLGFYPIAGSNEYELGSPLFKSAVVHLGNKTLQILTENYSPENKYVSKVWLNGTLLSVWKIKHSDIASGGILKFEMSKLPDRIME